MSAVTSTIIAGSAAALGAGATIYGASQNRVATNKAADANAKNTADTNARNYQTWLESKGVGQDGRPINTWLPRYLTAPAQIGVPQSRYRRISAAPVPNAVPPV